MSNVGGGEFSNDEKKALNAILDAVIPPRPDGKLPGAGEIGLADEIEQALQRTSEMRPVITEGLAAVRTLAQQGTGGDLTALPIPERAALLRSIEADQPAFLPTLMFVTYSSYYRHELVAQGLGLEARPPHPRGYEMPPNDLTLLDEVRQRPKMHRDGSGGGRDPIRR